MTEKLFNGTLRINQSINQSRFTILSMWLTESFSLFIFVLVIALIIQYTCMAGELFYKHIACPNAIIYLLYSFMASCIDKFFFFDKF